MNSRRAQTLVTAGEMVLRGEFPAHRTIEEVELSKALGASRPIVRSTLEKLNHEGLLEDLPVLHVTTITRSGDFEDPLVISFVQMRGASRGMQ